VESYFGGHVASSVALQISTGPFCSPDDKVNAGLTPWKKCHDDMDDLDLVVFSGTLLMVW